MAVSEFNLTLAIKNKFIENLDPIRISRAYEAAVKTAIRLIRERTLSGKDIANRKFSSLTPEYSRRKRNSRSREKMIKRAEKQFGRRTRYKAGGTPDFMRLTGRMLSEIRYRNVNIGKRVRNEIQYIVSIYVSERQRRKVDWLASRHGGKKSRVWFGLSSNMTQRQKEDKQIQDTFLKTLGINASMGVRT